MLTVAENERLTLVGPGTAMGGLLRRYWHPIAPFATLLENPVRDITILGENLVLYRDGSGQLGLVGPRCAHRLVHLRFGIPEEHGLRCPYHGWCYNEKGSCTDTPFEAEHSHLKERIQIPSYPVQELGGLVFAYLGPDPVPLLPPWDFLVWPNSIRQIAVSMLPCNWLQCQENSADPLHAAYLHGHFFKYQLERMGLLEERAGTDGMHPVYSSARRDMGSNGVVFEESRYGYRKGVRYPSDNGAEDRIKWANPSIFPYYSRGVYGSRTQVAIRVPLDDTHTCQFTYLLYHAPEVEAPRQEVVPYYEAPLYDDSGQPILDYVLAQDMAAWWSQGPITDRTQEHLGRTDGAIRGFRRLLEKQLDACEGGEDPINVFRDSKDVGSCIEIEPIIGAWDANDKSKVATAHYRSQLDGKGFYNDDVDRYGPITHLAEILTMSMEEKRLMEAAKGTS